MKPNSYDGIDEPYKTVCWFSHVERLLQSIRCSEFERVQLAYLRMKGFSEWWEISRLDDRLDLSWSKFKDKMYMHFFSTTMRKEKFK